MLSEPITTTESLARALEPLHACPVVTVDTEFIRETTFWPILCLIQIASEDCEILIDTLSPELDLEPFFELMKNESVLKVFHAARQDIEIIWHLSGSIPSPLFDTQVAAMVCGYGDSVGYDTLVRKTIRKEIDKSHRFTDWNCRPLSKKQLAYALADVTHLLQVYHVLNKKLSENRRADWMQEEMAILTSPSTYESHPDDAWARMKMRVKKPDQIAVFVEMAAWREREAKQRNLPRSRIIKDDVIHEIAVQIPRKREDLEQIRALGKGFARSIQAEAIIEVVEKALKRDRNSLPRIEEQVLLSGNVVPIAELLKVLLKKICDEQGVAPRIVGTTGEIERIAATDDTNIRVMQGWRRVLFGDMAQKLKHGEIGLSIKNGRVVVVPLIGKEGCLGKQDVAKDVV